MSLASSLPFYTPARSSSGHSRRIVLAQWSVFCDHCVAGFECVQDRLVHCRQHPWLHQQRGLQCNNREIWKLLLKRKEKTSTLNLLRVTRLSPYINRTKRLALPKNERPRNCVVIKDDSVFVYICRRVGEVTGRLPSFSRPHPLDSHLPTLISIIPAINTHKHAESHRKHISAPPSKNPTTKSFVGRESAAAPRNFDTCSMWRRHFGFSARPTENTCGLRLYTNDEGAPPSQT